MTTAKRPGLGAVLARPAYRRLFAAQTVSRWGDTFNTVALAPLAGALVATVGAAPAFLVNAASFAGSAVVLAGLRLPGRPAPTAVGSRLARIGEGARLLVADRLLRLLALVQLLAALSAGATSALLVVLAGRLVSLALGGVAADALGIRAVYYLGGGLLLVAGTTGLAGLPPRAAQRHDSPPAAQ